MWSPAYFYYSSKDLEVLCKKINSFIYAPELQNQHYIYFRQIIGDLGIPCDKLKVTEQGGAWNKPGQGYNSWSLLAGILSYSYARV